MDATAVHNLRYWLPGDIGASRFYPHRTTHWTTDHCTTEGRKSPPADRLRLRAPESCRSAAPRHVATQSKRAIKLSVQPESLRSMRASQCRVVPLESKRTALEGFTNHTQPTPHQRPNRNLQLYTCGSIDCSQGRIDTGDRHDFPWADAFDKEFSKPCLD